MMSISEWFDPAVCSKLLISYFLFLLTVYLGLLTEVVLKENN